MSKRLVALFVLIGMLIGLISSPAKAVTTVNKACSGGGTFEIVDDVVTGRSNSCIGSVVIPESVKLIDEWAFGETTGITSVTIPASVTEIYEGAFAASEIATINVASGNANYKSIDGVLFNKSGTTLLVYPSAKSGAYTIPASVTTIGVDAFAYATAITSVTLSANVANIGEGAFSWSTLAAINVVASNQTFKSIDGVLFSKDGATLVLYPTTKAGSYTIPADVTAIGDSAFEDAISLTAFVLPAGVTVIGEEAFAGATSLTSVTFEPGSKLTSIGEQAFRSTALTTFEIPSSVTTIGAAAFTDVHALTTFTFESSSKLTAIEDDTFRGTALTTIEIPASVTAIGRTAFSRLNSLTSVSFEAGSNLTSIGAGSFDVTGLTSVTIPASVASIGDGAFDSVFSLTSLTFESGSKLTSIGDKAFRWSGLTAVIIPASVTSIGEDAFKQTSLASVTFEAGSKLTSIGASAFYGSSKLASISIPASVTTIGDYVFAVNSMLTTVNFEAGSKLENLGQGAFGASEKLEAISIPAGVTTIRSSTFENAKLLASVTFAPGSKLTSIGQNAFRFTSLTEITIPVGVTSIGPFAFSFVTGLSGVNFLGNAPVVGSSIFYQSPNSATAYISNCATGFITDGANKWNGLAISVTGSSDPCIVVYNLNGGKGVTSGTLNLEGKVEAAPTPPTRAGYEFDGWSATNGGDLVTFPFGQSGSTNLTLFAKWTGNRNTVTYNSNGGSAVAAGSFISGGQIAEAPTEPTRANYTFLYWQDERGETVVFPYTPTSVTNITLYARWDYNRTPTPNPSTSSTPSPSSSSAPTPKPSASIQAKRKTVQFAAASSVLSKESKAAIRSLVKKAGKKANYVVTGTVGKTAGVPEKHLKATAKKRAGAVKAYLVQLGVKKSQITVKIKIVKRGITPKSEILAKYQVF